MMDKIEDNPIFLDDEEKAMMESLDLAIEAGDFTLSGEKEIEERKTYWKDIIKTTEKRRAITLRL